MGQAAGCLATTTLAGRKSRSRNLYPFRSCWTTWPSGTSAVSCWERASMQVRVERFADRIHLLQTGFGEHGFELLADHADARLQRLAGVRPGGLRRRQRHFKAVQHRHQLLQQGFVGVFDRLLLFAGGALLEIVEVRGGAQQAVPVLIRLRRPLFEFRQVAPGSPSPARPPAGVRRRQAARLLPVAFQFARSFFS